MHSLCGGQTFLLPVLARESVRCAAAFSTECILSPEIGLAVPSAFLYSHETNSMKQGIAPRILPHTETRGYETAKRHVRVTTPDTQATRSEIFNTTITAEYLDGTTRGLVVSQFDGKDALHPASSPCLFGRVLERPTDVELNTFRA